MSYSNKVVNLIRQWDEEHESSKKIHKQDMKVKKVELNLALDQLKEIKIFNKSLLRENKNLWNMVMKGGKQKPLRGTKGHCVSEREDAVAVEEDKEEDAAVEAEEDSVVAVEAVEASVVAVEAEEDSVVDVEESVAVEPEEEEDAAVDEKSVAVEEEDAAVDEKSVAVEEESVAVEEEESVAVEEESVAVEEAVVVEEEEEVFLVKIEGKEYYTTNEKSGLIYESLADDEVGDEVGYYEDGEPGFYE